MLGTDSANQVLTVFGAILLWGAIIMSLSVMIPQIIRLRKNKYADNSSVMIYACYLFCNAVWLVYMCLLVSLTAHGTHTVYQMILLSVQTLGELFCVILGAYSLSMKLYFNHNRKKNKKDRTAEAILKQRAIYLGFYAAQKAYVLKQLVVLSQQYPELYSQIMKDQKVEKLNTVEICVKITQIYRELYLINPHRQYVVSQELYHRDLKNTKNDIAKIKKQYPEIVYQSNHYAFMKHYRASDLFTIKKEAKKLLPNNKVIKKRNQLTLNEINYQAYMHNISLVSAWSYLCEIYQNFLSL